MWDFLIQHPPPTTSFNTEGRFQYTQHQMGKRKNKHIGKMLEQIPDKFNGIENEKDFREKKLKNLPWRGWVNQNTHIFPALLDCVVGTQW